MEENEFTSNLDKKIDGLAAKRQEVMDNLLNGSWHANVVEGSLKSALKELEDRDPAELPRLLLSIIEQVPALVKGIWTNGINDAQSLESEIARWQEMQQYYRDYLKTHISAELEKNVEEPKNKIENSSQNEEIAREALRAGIESGDINEPSKMSAIRREVGTHPGPTLGDYRNMKSELEDEQTTAADDSTR